MPLLNLLPTSPDLARANEVGFRLGDKGTHTTRTMMLAEIRQVFKVVPPTGKRGDYARVIIEENCLGKPTAATRRLTNQRLGELYGLGSNIPLFRVFRSLWDLDSTCQPLLALLCALARDPLLVATAKSILDLPLGSEFGRMAMRAAIQEAVGDRLNDSTVDKVARNAASSWTQSGHLEGRTLKVRRPVRPTPVSVSYALYLAYQIGFCGSDLFSSGWLAAIDCPPTMGRELALEAKRQGILDLRMAGDVVEISFDRLDQVF